MKINIIFVLIFSIIASSQVLILELIDKVLILFFGIGLKISTDFKNYLWILFVILSFITYSFIAPKKITIIASILTIITSALLTGLISLIYNFYLSINEKREFSFGEILIFDAIFCVMPIVIFGTSSFLLTKLVHKKIISN
jgi:hypothetical protein